MDPKPSQEQLEDSTGAERRAISDLSAAKFDDQGGLSLCGSGLPVFGWKCV